MAHIPRLYVDAPLNEGVTVALPKEQSHYLMRVMRQGQGAHIRVFNGREGEWQCALEIASKVVSIVPLNQTRKQIDPPDITLVYAPIKRSRTEYIVEKATELGVRTVQPVRTAYTQAGRVREDRLRAIMIEAAEQTERMTLPDLKAEQALDDVLGAWPKAIPLYYCDEGAEACPMLESLHAAKSGRGGLLVGPEGGFSPEERKELRKHAFVKPVTLGPRILRAETAVVSALALWQSQLGDWQERPYLPET